MNGTTGISYSVFDQQHRNIIDTITKLSAALDNTENAINGAMASGTGHLKDVNVSDWKKLYPVIKGEIADLQSLIDRAYNARKETQITEESSAGLIN